MNALLCLLCVLLGLQQGVKKSAGMFVVDMKLVKIVGIFRV